MSFDKAGRWIKGDELKLFSLMSFNERLRWIREELNKIYIGDYSVKKVASNSGVISHKGLYNMESNSESKPRQEKLQGIAEYYQVPVQIFSSHDPEQFFLGKQAPNSAHKSDIRSAQHSVELIFKLLPPGGGDPILEKFFSESMRHLDAEELLQRLQYELSMVQLRLRQQRKLDEAFDLITRQDASPSINP
jgi:transcriptional regulator with XRE-family HTH domain